jgi:uncharacterized protein DUF6526
MLGERKPQTFANHARFVPLFHFVTFGLLIVNLLYRIYKPFRVFSWSAVMDILLAAGLVLLAWSVRTFDTRLQDRIIRVEMRQRLAAVLSPDLRARIGELRESQLIALRFAPDAELPGLVADVLAGKLARNAEIKQRIQTWEPDYFRV